MPVMSSGWERQTVGRLMRDAILQVCKANHIYGGNVEVDAIVCITGKSEGQEMAVRVHEKLGTTDGRLALTDFLTRPRDGWTSMLNSHREEDAEDYSIKRMKLDDALLKTTEADSYPNLKQHLMTPSHARDLREMHDLRAKDLSMSSNAVALDMTPGSPQRSESYRGDSPTVSPTPDRRSQSPHSPTYNRYPYTSTPHSIFQRRIPLRGGERWSPNGSSIPECKPCGFTFNNYDILADHNEAVHSVFTCQSCFKTFTSRSNLERHSRLHTGHRPYGCNICGKSFSRKDHLTNHATKHAFKCGTCSKRFTDKKMLVTHYSFDHNAILTNICDFCNKGFSSNEQYDEHLKSHPQCGAGIRNDDDEMPQNLSLSSSPMKYLCKSCDFSTADRLTLLKHQVVHQESNRCYTCLSCSKMFEDPLHYSDHLLIHSTETNIFECCLCRQICPTLNSLRRHEATHLTSESPILDAPEYPCSQCHKTFASEYNLSEHMEIHAKSAGGFICSICSSEFENYSDMCSHIEDEGHYAYAQSAENGTDLSPKNKRKQKLPKAIKLPEHEQPGSDIEIVEPESPDDLPNAEDLSNGGPAGFITRTSTGQFVVTENPASVIEITPEEPEQQGVKRLLHQAIQLRKDRPDEMLERRERMNAIESALGVRRGSPSPQKSRVTDKASTSLAGPAAKPGETNNNVMISPKLMNVEIPPGPYTCSICSSEIPSFQELEMHCFSDHNRSPCMFCNKTFAQKANRDRHVCLHTGEKPYSCPDCSEKFSRGDKLKIHRMRVHQTSFPPMPPRSRTDDSGVDVSLTTESMFNSSTTSDSMFDAGEWAPMKGETQSQFVMAGGEWSVKDEIERVTEGVDEALTADAE